MIPNKLYIPTTTLNFNNIMASESISPASFYLVRGFGYKRFNKVRPNDLERRTILYDKYPVFKIDDDELENYPFVIEIDTRYVEEDIIHEYMNGAFYTEETIYLNPFSTKIYFRNENQKRNTLSKVGQSLNTKMLPLYQNCILVESSEIDRFEWSHCDLKDSTDNISKHISKDRKINKLKGFLYAYLLGANKSPSKDAAMLKKYSKELQNLLSAIITSTELQASYTQDVELNVLYQKINNAFYKAEGIDKTLQDIIERKTEYYSCVNFTEILRNEGLYDVWIQKQNLKPSYIVYPFPLSHFHSTTSTRKKNEYDGKKNEENQKYFDHYFAELENAINKIAKYVRCDIEYMPILQHCTMVSSVPTDKKGFQPKLFNEYCAENWNSEEFMASRLDFATVGGKLFKEELRDNWEGSPSKPYINGLRNNLASHTPFMLSSIDNLTLQSFAAFCQKGEEDISKLEDYLIQNGISDFRIAFALWGVVFGFANMPKTLTNDLFLSNDLDYISSVYKYIFKQIHGIELKGKIEEHIYITKQSKVNTTIVSTNSVESSLEIELSAFKEFISRDNTVQKEIITKLNEFGIHSLSDWDDKKADSIKWATSKGQKKAITAIKKTMKNAVIPKIQRKQSSLSLFTAENIQKKSDQFYRDTKAFDFLEYLLPSKIRKQFKEDLDWFQGNYQEYYEDKKKGKQKGFYFGKPTDNYSVIEKFQDYLKNKQNSNQDWLRKIYSVVDSEQIIRELKKVYL